MNPTTLRRDLPLFRTYVIGLRTRYMYPNAQICTYNSGENVFELMTLPWPGVSRTLLRKLGSLSLRRVLQQFHSWLRDFRLTEGDIKMFWGLWFKLRKELWWCVFAMKRFWRRIFGIYCTQNHCLIFRSSWTLCIATCVVSHCRWWSRWPASSSRGRSPFLQIFICLSDFLHFVNFL